jgi:hypothetical protein
MQAVRAEGSYSNGRLHIELLPTAVYGPATEKQFSLRRLDAVLSEAEQEEHMQKELLRVRGGLRVPSLPEPVALLCSSKCDGAE